MVHTGFRRAYGSVSVCLPHAIDRHNHGKQQDDHVPSYGSSSSMEKGFNGLRGDMVGISTGWISFSSRQLNSKRHREPFESDAGHSTPEEVSIEVSMALASVARVGAVGCCLFHKGLWNGNVCQSLFMSHSFGLLRQIKSLHCLFLSICPPSLLSRLSLLPFPPHYARFCGKNPYSCRRSTGSSGTKRPYSWVWGKAAWIAALTLVETAEILATTFFTAVLSPYSTN